jgi:hypothetical protein
MTESSIYQKIAKVILHDATQKISKGKQGYTSDDVYASVRTAMAENGLVCLTQFDRHYMQDDQNWVSFIFILVDTDSGERIESTWYQIVPKPNGMMTIDKCIGAASTYAHKYFLMRTFMLTSSDDPKIDAPSSNQPNVSRPDFEPKHEPAPQPQLTDEQVALNNEVKAKTELLKKLGADPALRSEKYYPNYQHLVNTMKLYTDEFGTDPVNDGFKVVTANLMNRKDKEAKPPL